MSFKDAHSRKKIILVFKTLYLMKTRDQKVSVPIVKSPYDDCKEEITVMKV